MRAGTSGGRSRGWRATPREGRAIPGEAGRRVHASAVTDNRPTLTAAAPGGITKRGVGMPPWFTIPLLVTVGVGSVVLLAFIARTLTLAHSGRVAVLLV